MLKYYVNKKEGDHMVYNGSRGKFGISPHRETHEALIKIAALAWWDFTLKGDAAAGAWLTGDSFATYLFRRCCDI